jgi:intein/homing endonuclease
MNVAAVYRHKVSKARWKVTLEDGKTVEVTNDHSIMVERNGKLIEVKASEILESDDFISIMHKPISNDIR